MLQENLRQNEMTCPNVEVLSMGMILTLDEYLYKAHTFCTSSPPLKGQRPVWDITLHIASYTNPRIHCFFFTELTSNYWCLLNVLNYMKNIRTLKREPSEQRDEH